MAYGIVHYFPGGTKEQYEATLAAVHSKDSLSIGQTFHATGASAGGWTVVAIHDSKESWERFRISSRNWARAHSHWPDRQFTSFSDL